MPRASRHFFARLRLAPHSPGDLGGQSDALKPDNIILWEKNTESTDT